VRGAAKRSRKRRTNKPLIIPMQTPGVASAMLSPAEMCLNIQNYMRSPNLSFLAVKLNVLRLRLISLLFFSLLSFSMQNVSGTTLPAGFAEAHMHGDYRIRQQWHSLLTPAHLPVP
jgi:hypothetical protein